MKFDFKDAVNKVHSMREDKDHDKDTKKLLLDIGKFSVFCAAIGALTGSFGVAGAVTAAAKLAFAITFIMPPVVITAVIATGMTYAAVKNFKQFKKDAKELMPKIITAPFIFPVEAAKVILQTAGNIFTSAKNFLTGKKETLEVKAPEAVEPASGLGKTPATPSFNNAVTPDADATPKATTPGQKPDAPKL
jgi:hypothetical protein